MSGAFSASVNWLEGDLPDPLERMTFGDITIDVDGQVATSLVDVFSNTTRSGFRAPAVDLAAWLVENWWRLRWEPENTSLDWYLSHVLTGIGGGTAWPNLAFKSDGVHVLVEARRNVPGEIYPVRYLNDIDMPIDAGAFEAGADGFIERVLGRLSALNAPARDLSAAWSELGRERREPDLSALRRLEALLGFDPEGAPESLIAALNGTAREAGIDAVEEMAAAEKAETQKRLKDVLEHVRGSGHSLRLHKAEILSASQGGSDARRDLPWKRAETAAATARQMWGIEEGLVDNGVLSDRFDLDAAVLEGPLNGSPLAAGLRKNDGDEINIVLRAKVPTGRRFELMRTVADHLAAGTDDRLLPVTRAATDRQKFQRAFAQEFLMPYRDVCGRFCLVPGQRADIDDNDIEDIAHDYMVSPLMVKTVLVNNGHLPRETLVAA